MKDFLTILKQLAEARKCPGCLAGGGNPGCPMKTCTGDKGYLTCAECDRLPCAADENGKRRRPDERACHPGDDNETVCRLEP